MSAGGRVIDGLRYVLPLIAVWGVPLVVLAVVDPGDIERSAVFTDVGKEHHVVVGQRTDDGSQSVSFQLTWSEPQSVVWTHGDGVVTDIAVPVDRPLKDGDPLLSVDGVAVVAQATGTPLYRDVTVGMGGPDVAWVDALLVEGGFAASSTLDGSGRATSAIADAIGRWQASIGAPQLSEAFERRFTLYVGSDAVVSDVLIHLGDTASAGLALMAVTPALIDVDAMLLGPDERHRLVEQVPIIVTIGSSDIELEDVTVTDTDIDILAAHVAAGIEMIEAAGVRRAEPVDVGVVPASAIVVSDRGMRCVVMISPVGTRDVIAVGTHDIVPLEPGVAYVDASLAGATVVSNPTHGDATECA